MRFLLDTCLLSELIKPEPKKSVVAWIESQSEIDFGISVLTLGELQKGVSKLETGKKKDSLEKWLHKELLPRFGNRMIPVSGEVAMHWGELSGKAEREGKTIPVLDGLIAATALVYKLRVVTRDTTDIARTGAVCINPWEAS